MEMVPDLQDVIAIARIGGAYQRAHYARGTGLARKSSTIDLVTEADTAVEAYLVEALLELTPDGHIVGEEGGAQGQPLERASHRWVVDPIDGTTNFASRIPHFCVSIALVDADDQPLLGVVVDPMRDEVFAAAQGHGAWLNGRRLRVSATEALIDAVLASGFPYDKHTASENNAARWTAFMLRSRGVRRFGSAALDLCYVASGRFDGYWEHSLKPWDALAGVLLVREAGGTVTDYQGGHDRHMPGGYYVASNGHIHAAMLDVLRATP
jgi:myo-inositol-1(or 4)-monophosphatase